MHLSVSKQVLLRVKLMQPFSQEFHQLLHLSLLAIYRVCPLACSLT
nr:MAG TPA: hypothetical protein [Crassvirales sp.]